MRAYLLFSLLPAACLLAEEAPSTPPPALSARGADRSVERLVEIHRLAGRGDSASVRALAAAYARLQDDPGFSEAERVAVLQALAAAREPAGGPLACRALEDASRPVRAAALQLIRDLRHAPAVPALVDLMAKAGTEPLFREEDLGLAQRASDLLETLANHAEHYEALSTRPEQQVAVARWREWWGTHQGQTRLDWQRQGFEESGVKVSLPLDPAGVAVLVEALPDTQPAWIRENALELLSTLPTPAVPEKKDGRVSQPACEALAKGLSHADEKVQMRSALALYRVLAAGAHADLPSRDDRFDALGKALSSAPFKDAAEASRAAKGAGEFVREMKSWWGAHGNAS